MAVIGFRRSSLSLANRSQMKVLRWVTRVSLGADKEDTLMDAGALYETAGGVEWHLFSDLGITLEDIANLATVCAGLSNIPMDWVDGLTRSETRSKVVNYVKNNRVWPVVIPEGTVDPVDYVVQAQLSVPAWFAARQTIPPGLTPKAI